jgi:hypothetical protein
MGKKITKTRIAFPEETGRRQVAALQERSASEELIAEYLAKKESKKIGGEELRRQEHEGCTGFY